MHKFGSTGTGEFDILNGGPGIDVSFLGFGTDALNFEPQTFYVGEGDSDYALITGFDREEDVLLLGGESSSYKQEIISFSGEGFDEVTSLEVSFTEENGEDRIAIVAGIDTPLNINPDGVFADTFLLQGTPPEVSPDDTNGNTNPLNGDSNDNILLANRGDIIFGGEGSDILDASIGGGKNRLYGGTGDDELIALTEDRLFGGLGNDILDGSFGEGNNRLYGGDGDDIFFLGKNDFLVGGKGNDAFFVGTGGGNNITGGAGSDAFWIANAELPDAVNTITDFEVGVDTIGIGILGVTNLDDLVLDQIGDDTTISFSGSDLAVLLNTQVTNLQQNGNFVFV